MINIKTDSRKVVKGDTFVAIKGLTVDGHDFIEQAILNGASKVICEHGNYEVETIVVKNTKEWLKETLLQNYQKQINELTLIGVTGTNGKTTTCFLTYQLLKELKVKVAYIGTIGFYMEGTKRELPNTTPEMLEIYSLILEAKEKGCTHIVMEVSSHALSEKRIEGLEFEIEAFTNLTEDHLDFHKTMESYLQAKLQILDYLKTNGHILINIDDEHGKDFQIKPNKTIGFQGEDYKILHYKDILDKTTITFQNQNQTFNIETNLKSKFNVYNYLFCLAIVHQLGFSINDIEVATKNIYPPKGRCEQIKVFDSYAVIDYAHTPDAVEKIIQAFLENKQGKIITIIGCGGDRDPLKRPIMGKIATDLSDYVIFTSDNPRTEDKEKILNDITKDLQNKNFEIEIDRKKAIYKGLDLAKKQDVVLILGKGHENYQIIGHEKIHFDDKEEVLNYIEKKDFN